MNRFAFCCAAALMSLSASIFASTPQVIKLWPDGAPHKSGLENKKPTGSNDFITGTNEAVLTIFPAENATKALLMCPGGGYAGVAMNHEGFDMAEWFNKQGITYGVLQYRMPNGHREVPFEDAEKAMRVMRSMLPAGTKVGIGGASAGGHLAATVATLYTEAATRPDFQVLFYPVISMQDGVTHGGSRNNLLGNNPSADLKSVYSLQNQVNAATPPAFIMLSADDGAVPPRNSIDYLQALLDAGVKSVIHIYPTEGHGWGFRDVPFKPLWQAELETWLRNL